jgi:hypothetical protein
VLRPLRGVVHLALKFMQAGKRRRVALRRKSNARNEPTAFNL